MKSGLRFHSDIVMAYIVMAYIVMAYTVMAYIVIAPQDWTGGKGAHAPPKNLEYPRRLAGLTVAMTNMP